MEKWHLSIIYSIPSLHLHITIHLLTGTQSQVTALLFFLECFPPTVVRSKTNPATPTPDCVSAQELFSFSDIKLSAKFYHTDLLFNQNSHFLSWFISKTDKRSAFGFVCEHENGLSYVESMKDTTDVSNFLIFTCEIFCCASIYKWNLIDTYLYG